MATYEKIEEKSKMAEEEYKKAVEELKKWEEGKYKGEKLNELEDDLMKGDLTEKQEKNVKERRDRLLEEKKKLEEKEDFWRGRVEKLQDALVKFGGEGNEQIA